MNFPCPKCNTPDKGVLLFNLVAPCDACSGIVPEKKREKYTVHQHKELKDLKDYYAVALGCGDEKQAVINCLNSYPPDGEYGYDSPDSEFIQVYARERPEDYCVVQWSK